MCNASNHSPGCMCGWGGEGHLGRGGGGGGGWHSHGLNSFITTPYGNIITTILSFETFVNANAICPVCGEQVFYYQSPNGGKVYFDALGPPWPKHPCTDNGYVSSQKTIQIKGTYRNSIWKDNGWTPFIVNNITNINEEITKITGKAIYQNNDMDLFIKRTVNVPTNLNYTLNEKHSKNY